MIYIKDNFLDKELLINLESKILNSKWKTHKVEGNKFNFKIRYQDVDEKFQKYIETWLGIMEQADVKIIRSFIRKSNKNFDTNWRIHNDYMIEGQKPDRALVFYLSENKSKKQNGTAFWKHKKYGYSFENFNVEDFNNLLINDSEDISKWELQDIIMHKKNRLLSYPCNYFHSKYPNKIKDRKVLVAFYTSKQWNYE